MNLKILAGNTNLSNYESLNVCQLAFVHSAISFHSCFNSLELKWVKATLPEKEQGENKKQYNKQINKVQ